MGRGHRPVLLEEAIAALMVSADGAYVDGTFGRGGHSTRILDALSPLGTLAAFDQDPAATVEAARLAERDSRFRFQAANFRDLGNHIAPASVQGVLLDLGVSSPQLDDPDRGFSFSHDGPLDMRMNPGEGISASDWINAATEIEIADTLYEFGEERFSRRIARRIITARESKYISTTSELAEIVREAIPVWKKEKHPATQVFQAIRILINRELDELKLGLVAALNLLRLGGRLVVISFHSLEDRIVKQFIMTRVTGDKFPRDLPITSDVLRPQLKKIKNARKPRSEEVYKNPRARSAVMRVAEKLN